MSKRPARFTEADLRRAMKVAAEAGKTVDILPDGTLRIVPMPPGEPCEGAPKNVVLRPMT